MAGIQSVQIPCPQCGNVAWVPVGSTTYCSKCGAALATAAAQSSMGSMPERIPGVPSMGDVLGGGAMRLIGTNPQSGKRVLGVVVGLIFVTVVGSIAWFSLKQRLGVSAAKGNLAYAQLGLDIAHGDPDKMIAVVGDPARRWARDAVWWSLAISNLRADGTIDLTEGGTVVTYISLSRVQSVLARDRKDSVKEFSFGPAGVNWLRVMGTPKAWTGVVAPIAPGCTIKQLTELLHAHGLVEGKTVRVVFDPTTSRLFGKPDSWHVTGTDPKLDMSFAIADCSVTDTK